MKQLQSNGVSFFLFSIVLLGGAMAFGQAAPDPNAATGRKSSGGEQSQTQMPAKPLNNNNAVQVATLMERNGGSLLKASLSVQADPSQAKLSQLSYFAVPEPEPKTLKKHDLVTVVVNEASATTSKAQNNFQKNAELQAEINQMIQIKWGKGTIYGLPQPSATPGIDLTGLRTFNGQGELDRSDTMNARITAEVLDVKPNGNIVLQARKHIKTDDDEQQFVLTGICRAEDINPDNTILSSQLYDLQLIKNSKGDVRQSTERGNLPKLLDFINPF